ncbi:MAG: geranylgeranylglyceryl/heptaprenylglyceryl phosphate synthase [Candidatus Bathyarchaeia archaeon]
MVDLKGRVESYLNKKIEEEGTIHLTLLDPEKLDRFSAIKISKNVEKAGSKAIMIGGSTVSSIYHLDEIVKGIKDSRIEIPVILFPNDLTGISKFADAVFFMSLLNSYNPYYIIRVQALASPLIKKYGMEPLPLGYIIVGGESTAAYIGQAHQIPPEKPELAVAYALAAQYLGMRFVYLEAGSGAKKPVPASMVKKVRESIDIPLIVGGGIRSPRVAKTIAEAGASVIVTGTAIEITSIENIERIVRAIKK